MPPLPRAPHDLLLPLPRKLELRPGAFALAGPLLLDPPPGFASPALDRLRAELTRRRIALGPSARVIRLVLDGRAGHGSEGYALTIAPQRIEIVGSKGAGLNHGLRTLVQLLPAPEPSGPAPALPALAIEDAPAFARRGVMLDVSRDRVPRMDHLFALVERLAAWKLNELQLYFEHTFAYRDHERVWRGVDPFTRDELHALDGHCAAHGIELVPNQQSFGHLHHWLKLSEYRHLAEVPDGIVHPFLGAGETAPQPFSLCPTDPRSLEFLGRLYDELLPCFTSREFNVGLDETIDLGPGRSAAAIREKGVGRVYLEFLRSVHGLVSARGKRMQFWADILLNHAELVPEVPKDAVAMLWGYEGDHPFEEETRTLAEAGLEFYVCPGTSSWQSIGGRLDNMLANVHSAARWGAARGAKGLLVTDWGDRGHLQPAFASVPGFLTAAALAWNPEDGRLGAADDLTPLLGTHAFSTVASHRAVALGKVSGALAMPLRNASPLSVLLTRFDAPFPTPELSTLTRVTLGDLADELRRLVQPPLGSGAVPRDQDLAEARWAAHLMQFACSLGRARREAADGQAVRGLPEPQRRRLALELEPLIAEHRALWLERSRPGGLERSARWLERILAALR
jgi:hexosaminidase